MSGAPDFSIKPADAPKSTPAPAPAARKRGRPTGTTKDAKATITDAELRQALKVMDSFYNMVQMGLMVGQFPMAAEHFATASDELRKQNEVSLAASPSLVKWLNKQGNTSGAGAFVLTNGMAFATLGLVLRGELAVRRAAKEYAAEQAAQEGQ